MTTGRINQVRTIGGARARWAPPARVRAGGGAPTRARAPPWPGLTPSPLTLRRRARGLSPVQAASDARARLPTPRRSAPRACAALSLGPVQAASDARARLPAPRARSGAELPMRGAPAGARSPAPACAALSLGPVQAASDARARLPAPRRSAPRAGLGAELPMRGGPLGRSLANPRPAPSSPGRTASPPPSGSHIRSAGASMRQAVARPSVLSGCVLRLGRRRATRRPQPARFPWDGRPRGKTPPGYAAATACLTPRAHLDATAHRRQDTTASRRPLAPWPPPEALPPCALCADPTRLPHTICSGTMGACENGGPPPLPFSGGEESQARRPAGRARARGCDWAWHTCGREGRRNAPEPRIPIQAVII